jgi:hypothetical protein
MPKDLEVEVAHEEIFFATAFFFWSLLSLLIAGLVIVALLKNFSKDYLTLAKSQIGKSIGYGVLLFLLAPLAIVILAVLVLTIPISLIILAGYLVLVYLSLAFSALFIGDYIMSFFRKESTKNGLYLSMLIGVILVTVLVHIPLIGAIFGFIIVCFGMGSLVNYIWNLKQKPVEG